MKAVHVAEGDRVAGGAVVVELEEWPTSGCSTTRARSSSRGRAAAARGRGAPQPARSGSPGRCAPRPAATAKRFWVVDDGAARSPRRCGRRLQPHPRPARERAPRSRRSPRRSRTSSPASSAPSRRSTSSRGSGRRRTPVEARVLRDAWASTRSSGCCRSRPRAGSSRPATAGRPAAPARLDAGVRRRGARGGRPRPDGGWAVVESPARRDRRAASCSGRTAASRSPSSGWGGRTPNGIRVGPVYTPPDAPRPRLRDRPRRRALGAAARRRTALLLPLHRPRQPDLERDLRADRLRQGLRVGDGRLRAALEQLRRSVSDTESVKRSIGTKAPRFVHRL